MRAAFGLIGILGLLVAVILFWSYAYLPYTQQVVSQGQSAQAQAEQMAGIDSELGGRVSEHVALEPVSRGGKLYGLQVKAMNAGSSFESHYGLKPGDVIDQIGPQMVRDMDEGMAQALAFEAYQRKWELGVLRNGQRVMLPDATAAAGTRTLAPNAATPPPTPTGQPAAAQPAQPAQPQPDPNMTPLQRQMDAILNRPQ